MPVGLCFNAQAWAYWLRNLPGTLAPRLWTQDPNRDLGVRVVNRAAAASSIASAAGPRGHVLTASPAIEIDQGARGGLSRGLPGLERPRLPCLVLSRRVGSRPDCSRRDSPGVFEYR